MSLLSKRPKHVAFLFLEPTLSLEDAARAVFLSICAGASHVSLYDFHGRLKAGQLELLRALQRTQTAFLARTDPPAAVMKRIHWHSHSQSEAAAAAGANGNGR